MHPQLVPEAGYRRASDTFIAPLILCSLLAPHPSPLPRSISCRVHQARLFPVLKQPQGDKLAASAAAADVVMWMQDVQDHAASSSSAGAAGPDGRATTAAAEWLSAERLSFKEILARADPGAEFKWRRQLEEGMGEGPSPGGR